MASITIRQLDDELKQRLRLRAARNGRSMEDEARTILRQVAALESEAARQGGRASRQCSRAGAAGSHPGRGHETRPADHRRRHRGLQIARPDPPAEGARACRALHSHRARRSSSSRRSSAGALSGERAFTDLFDPTTEFDVGHIRLAREADLIVVAPATADLMAKMAGGHADDLASAVLLATDRPILLAPAMNPRMWEHPATRRNLARLAGDGVAVVGPNAGEMAEAARPASGAWRSRSRSRRPPCRCWERTTATNRWRAGA